MLSDIFPTGYHGTELARVSPGDTGDTVAIFGAGPVGLMAAHSTALRGAAQVFVMDKEPDRLAQVRCVGLAGQAAVPGQESGEGDPLGIGERGIDRGE
jgi:glutathione-independent formaldehyde dehydrogenase